MPWLGLEDLLPFSAVREQKRRFPVPFFSVARSRLNAHLRGFLWQQTLSRNESSQFDEQMESLFWSHPTDRYYQVFSWLHSAEFRKCFDRTRWVYSPGIAFPFLPYESFGKIRYAQKDSHVANTIPVIRACRPIVQAPHRGGGACLQMREIFWKIAVLDDGSMC